ncbi:MAG: LAGLIDADG family homing endonuclease [Candidatus Pacebacteria bacterium]|nr:LAGLIDADG family homing endonuclease [Candidatus Paceibacterota bacterium]
MLNPNYIVGLVDGEGSFTVYVRQPNSAKKVKRRARAEPRFYLKLIEKDKDILYMIKRFFSCGSVYFQKDNRINHQNCYRYEVANRKDLEEIIIPFFKRHQLKLLSKKKDFRIFCELMRRIKKGEHHTKLGLRHLYLIKQGMH